MVLVPLFDSHVQVVACLQEVFSAVLELVSADVLDDAHFDEADDVFVGSEELDGLHFELGVVWELLNVLLLDDAFEGFFLLTPPAIVPTIAVDTATGGTGFGGRHSIGVFLL